MVAIIKALIRRDGLRFGADERERTARRFAVLDVTGAVSPALRSAGAPFLAELDPLNATRTCRA